MFLHSFVTLLVTWLDGWLAGCLVGELVGSLVCWLADWPAGWLVVWLVGWLVSLFVGWLVSCWLDGLLVGQQEYTEKHFEYILLKLWWRMNLCHSCFACISTSQKENFHHFNLIGDTFNTWGAF